MNISDSTYYPPGISVDESVWSVFEEGSVTNVDKESAIYRQGEVADKLYYIKKGTVNIISSANGVDKILNVCQQGDIFGEAPFFEKGDRVSSAKTLTACELIEVRYDELPKYFAKYPQLALTMIEYLSKVINVLCDQVDNVTFLRADRRIARFLLNSYRKTQRVYCTHEDIAQAVDLNRVTVTQTLTSFVNKGWISTAYHYIHIADVQALSDFTYNKEISNK